MLPLHENKLQLDSSHNFLVNSPLGGVFSVFANIPHILDMLLNLEGFQWATSLDLNMGYYHIELNPNSKNYCTIVMPFGKYEY